ncbi:phage tail protein [Pseudomonas tohonis]|uniref:phage tail protein n=1 Tax=Pseudomonas tohonis TaxID=2725477 RepID=UPI0021DA0E45|nr:hypothetical protein [Pseudomonas tohonis]UXY51317.1 hypothetical protein N9L84_20430 [Pseudomonas tohonis]
MTQYNRPNEMVFASGAKPGELESFPDITRGWGVTFDQTTGIPPMEWFNALFKRSDEAVRYLLQRGIAEWSSTEDYPVDAHVQEGGKVWKAKAVSVGKRPSLGTGEWIETAMTSDAVNALIQDQLGGIGIKGRVRAASTVNLNLSGLQVVDGVNLTAGDRVLVKNQAAGKDNGIYVVTTGPWTRSSDADTSAEMTPGLMVAVEQGSSQADSVWQLVTDGPINLGTTALGFEMVFGRNLVTAGSYDIVTVNNRGMVVGGAPRQVVALSTDTTLAGSQMSLVVIDASAAARTITLPASNSALGVVDVIVRRQDNSGNRLVVQAANGDRVRFHTHLNSAGYSFFVLMGAGDYWHLRSDGAGSWYPLDRLDSTPLGRPTFDTSTLILPGGYGALNGGLLNRADWPWLWDHAQQSGILTTEAARAGMEGGWANGDGATTFRLPDLRGEFLRGLDEGRGVDQSFATGNLTIGSPTIASFVMTGAVAVGMSISGAGIPAGATVISIAGGNITISASATATAAGAKLTVAGRVPGSNESDAMQGHWHGPRPGTTINGSPGYWNGNGSGTNGTYNIGSIGDPVTDGYSGAPRTGPETRPRSVAYPLRAKFI